MYNTRSLILSSGIALGLIAGAFSTVSYAQTVQDAAGAANVTYPIAELGSCKNKKDCKAYCDQSAHMSTCVAFAEKQGLLKGENLRMSKIVAEKVAAGKTPGGCTDAKTCEAYCNGNVEHLNACIAFGEQLGVIPQRNLAEAKRVASALAKGASMPGSCKTKAECENYCAAGAHIDECLNFAEAAGMLPAEELAQARKVAPFLRSGETPGKCTTKASCEAYCADDAHFEACLGFAEKVGFVSAADAAIAKKTGGKGPGSCRSKDQCEAYCNEPAHAAECLNFAKEKGLLSEEQRKLVDTGVDQLRAGLEKVPAEARTEVMNCLENAVGGRAALERILAKQDTPTKAMGDKFQGCFANVARIMQKVMTEKYQQAGQTGVPGGAGIQGGAAVPGGMGMPGGVGAPMQTEMQTRIEQEMQNRVQGIPGGAVPAPGVAPAGGAVGGQQPVVPVGVAPAGRMIGPGPDMCGVFANVPSCDLVPAGQAHDLCVKCKAQ